MVLRTYRGDSHYVAPSGLRKIARVYATTWALSSVDYRLSKAIVDCRNQLLLRLDEIKCTYRVVPVTLSIRNDEQS